MADTIDLEDKVVAVFDTDESTDRATADLRARGYEVEVLRGEEGARRLDPTQTNDEGLLGSLRAAAVKALGGQDRIAQRVGEQLEDDRALVVVDASGADHTEIAACLKEHGGHFRWYFGQWTYVPLGDE